MQTAGREIEAMAGALPGDATYEEARYRLCVPEKIRKGQESIDRNGGMAQAEVERRLRKWRMG